MVSFWAFRTPGGSTEFLSAEKRNCSCCARFAPGIPIKSGLGCFIYPPSNSLPKEGGPEAVVMDVGLPFSSSLTLREVMELLFAVGARRWRLAKSLVASYQVLMNGGIRQVGGVTFWWRGGGGVAAGGRSLCSVRRRPPWSRVAIYPSPRPEGTRFPKEGGQDGHRAFAAAIWR